ncbi:hypothetical protein EDF27_0968 [Curtobacterium sp. PhB136]|nr:hypothetical protein EDF27_0968 [Curtobacterium sp. PhB136]
MVVRRRQEPHDTTNATNATNATTPRTHDVTCGRERTGYSTTRTPFQNATYPL